MPKGSQPHDGSAGGAADDPRTDDPPTDGPPTDDHARVQLQVTVRGNVQGVGFRWWVREQADRFGLVGRAVNEMSGDVEIVVEGRRVDCQRLLAALKGRTPGHVRSVSARWSTPQGLSGFRFG